MWLGSVSDIESLTRLSIQSDIDVEYIKIDLLKKDQELDQNYKRFKSLSKTLQVKNGFERLLHESVTHGSILDSGSSVGGQRGHVRRKLRHNVVCFRSLLSPKFLVLSR